MANPHPSRETWLAFLFTLSLLLWPAAGRAQTAITGASVGGEIHDATGSVLADVVIDARELATNQKWQTRSDPQGRYRFLALPVGSYEVSARRDGFARRLVSLTLGLGQRVELPFTLEVSATETQRHRESPRILCASVPLWPCDLCGLRVVGQFACASADGRAGAGHDRD